MMDRYKIKVYNLMGHDRLVLTARKEGETKTRMRYAAKDFNQAEVMKDTTWFDVVPEITREILPKLGRLGYMYSFDVVY